MSDPFHMVVNKRPFASHTLMALRGARVGPLGWASLRSSVELRAVRFGGTTSHGIRCLPRSARRRSAAFEVSSSVSPITTTASGPPALDRAAPDFLVRIACRSLTQPVHSAIQAPLPHQRARRLEFCCPTPRASVPSRSGVVRRRSGVRSTAAATTMSRGGDLPTGATCGR